MCSQSAVWLGQNDLHRSPETFPTPSETPDREAAPVLPEVSILAGGSGKGGTTLTALSHVAGNKNSSKTHVGPHTLITRKAGQVAMPSALPASFSYFRRKSASPEHAGSEQIASWSKNCSNQIEPLLYSHCPFHILPTCFNRDIQFSSP